MKIIRLDCRRQEFRLREPYTIAYESIDRCVNLFLEMETDTGLIGRGCAAPDLPVTGETPESVLAVFDRILEPIMKNEDPFRYARVMDTLKEELLKVGPGSSALAMADMALYDIMAQKAGVPLYQLLGGYRDSIATSVTIGILPVVESVNKARDLKRQGFRILKIKGGRSVEEDIDRILKIRRAVGQDTELRFDANQGYSVEEAVHFIKQTATAAIELLEQPTDSNNEALLKQVSQRISVPVMADESLMTLKDVFRLTRHDSTDMINIKLMKTGGIHEALHINSVAKAAGVEAMIGCMDESALGIAAGLHFALARANILYADLDGHLDLLDDPFAGMIRLEKGILYPAERPGLGWGG